MTDLSLLNEPQKKAVTHFTGPLLILAGAGSGKTRVITYRIAWLIEDMGIRPWNIMAVTFTNKAAGEMRSRVQSLTGDISRDVMISTFHSACVRILRRNAEALGYKTDFTIYDSDDQKSLMREIIKYLNLDPKKFREKTFLNEISHAKDQMITPEEYARLNNSDYSKKNYIRAYEEYEKRLKNANAFDFDDLLLKTVILFEENPEILEYYRNRWRFIMVDEYQDTNKTQFRLIQLLADYTAPDGTHQHNLCVVGDDDQSIYGFRGADIENILTFEDVYPEAQVIRLEENYRSTSVILDAANAVIGHNTRRKGKNLWTQKGKGDPIRYRLFENDIEEAEGVMDAVSHGVNSGKAKYCDFAVLYRTNAQSRPFEESCVRRGIPYRIVGGINFYQRREIKDVLAYMRVLVNPDDTVSLRRIINVPKRGIGLTTLDRVSRYADTHGTSIYNALLDSDYIDGIKRAKLKIDSFTALMEDFKKRLENEEIDIVGLINSIMDETGYEKYLEAEDESKFDSRMENIDALRAKAKEYFDTESSPTLAGFLENISLVADIDSTDSDENVVLLMTLHAAKGLEFPYVFMPGMEDDLFPGYNALNALDLHEREISLEEERRLCYVGITRAREKLSMSSVTSRFRNGEYEYNRPSLFLSEIPRSLMNFTTGRLMTFGDEDDNDESSGADSFSGKSFSGRGNFSSSGRKGGYGSGNSRSSYSGGVKSFNAGPQHSGNKNSYSKKDGLETLFKTLYVPSEDGKSELLKNPEGKPEKSSGTEKNVPQFKTGDRVNHPKFGTGTIEEAFDMKADQVVKIKFDDGSVKKVRTSFAKLKKI